MLKSDQEAAIADVLNGLAKRRSADSKLEKADSLMPEGGIGISSGAARVIHEKSPVASSGSNGFIERGIQDVEGQVRTLKLALQSRIGETISSDHNIVPWIAEYAALLLNRSQVGKDGETAYERLKGKPCSLPGLQFGEQILWRRTIPPKDRKFKIDSENYSLNKWER